MKGKSFLLTALFVLFTAPTVRAEVMEYLGTSANVKIELSAWKQKVGTEQWKQGCATETPTADKSHFGIAFFIPKSSDAQNAGCSDAMPAFTNDLLDLSGKTKLGYLVDIPVVNIPDAEKKGCEGYENKKDCPQFEHFRFVAAPLGAAPIPPRHSSAASSVPVAPVQPHASVTADLSPDDQAKRDKTLSILRDSSQTALVRINALTDIAYNGPGWGIAYNAQRWGVEEVIDAIASAAFSTGVEPVGLLVKVRCIDALVGIGDRRAFPVLEKLKQNPAAVGVKTMDGALYLTYIDNAISAIKNKEQDAAREEFLAHASLDAIFADVLPANQPVRDYRMASAERIASMPPSEKTTEVLLNVLFDPNSDVGSIALGALYNRKLTPVQKAKFIEGGRVVLRGTRDVASSALESAQEAWNAHERVAAREKRTAEVELATESKDTNGGTNIDEHVDEMHALFALENADLQWNSLQSSFVDLTAILKVRMNELGNVDGSYRQENVDWVLEKAIVYPFFRFYAAQFFADVGVKDDQKLIRYVKEWMDAETEPKDRQVYVNSLKKIGGL